MSEELINKVMMAVRGAAADARRALAKEAYTKAVALAKAKCEESIAMGKVPQTAYNIYDKEVKNANNVYYQAMGWW